MTEFAGRHFGDLLSLLVVSFTQFYPCLFTCIHSFPLAIVIQGDFSTNQIHFQQHNLASLAVMGQMLV